MINRAMIVFLIFITISSTLSQDNQNDSLRIGRYCNIVLKYGFQAEGKIAQKNVDTVWLETDVTVLHIPIKDIKFVLNSDFELNSDGVPEVDSSKYMTAAAVDTTIECDLYLDGKIKLASMRLLPGTDSTFFALREGRKKEFKYSDVRKIVFKTGASFGRGFFEVGGIFFAVGFFTVALRKESEGFGGVKDGILFGILSAIPAGLIGGVIYAMTSTDDVYLFDKGNYESKTKKIKYLIQKHH